MGWTPAPIDFRHDGVRHTCNECKYADVMLPNEPCQSCFGKMRTLPFSKRIAEAFIPKDTEQHLLIKSMIEKYEGSLQKMLDDLRENGLTKSQFEYQFKKR